MSKMIAVSAVLIVGVAVGSPAAAMDDMTSCPMHAQHVAAAKANADGSEKHGAGVDGRHDALAPSHESTHHVFRLFADGGAIELLTSGANDTTTIDAIRAHIRVVAEQFSANDFSTPMFVHAKAPDGVAGMQRLHDQISFRYETLASGARIRIQTSNPEALAAVHSFLKFQVVEHRTGDSAEVEQEGK